MNKCEQCIVRQFSSLKALNKEELMRMSDCKASYTVKKGEKIFEEGQRLDGVYCIKSGICKLSKLSSNGRTQILKFVKKGDLLGLRTILGSDTVNLSAIAVEDMEVCHIPKTEILKAFHDNHQFSEQVLKEVCDGLKLADNMLVNMAQKPVKERLASYLLEFQEDFGTDSEGYLGLHLTREEIAGMVGTATESLIRMLSDFNKRGLIQIDGKRIKILNTPSLERIAEGM